MAWLCFCISLEREEAEDLIKRHGGRITGSVSKKTVISRYFFFPSSCKDIASLLLTLLLYRIISCVMKISGDGNPVKQKS